MLLKENDPTEAFGFLSEPTCLLRDRYQHRARPPGCKGRCPASGPVLVHQGFGFHRTRGPSDWGFDGRRDGIEPAPYRSVAGEAVGRTEVLLCGPPPVLSSEEVSEAGEHAPPYSSIQTHTSVPSTSSGSRRKGSHSGFIYLAAGTIAITVAPPIWSAEAALCARAPVVVKVSSRSRTDRPVPSLG